MQSAERLNKWPFWTIFGPWWGRGPKFIYKDVSQNARRREEENEPIGETIGAEMAKRLRDIHTHRHTHTQTHTHTDIQAVEEFVNRYL